MLQICMKFPVEVSGRAVPNKPAAKFTHFVQAFKDSEVIRDSIHVFLLTDHCTTTRVRPVTDITSLKDHLQTEGHNFFPNF